MNEHDAQAPSAYPEVHHLTSPIRAAAREAGDAQAINLWAGQGHELARQVRVGELLRQLTSEAALTVRREADRLSSGSGSDSG
jgi:nitronate monooxygenase